MSIVRAELAAWVLLLSLASVSGSGPLTAWPLAAWSGRLAAGWGPPAAWLPPSGGRLQSSDAAPRVVPLQVTGDPAARFSMVVMGDGYTEAERPKFRAHVDKHLNVLWSIEPFRSYRSYINVYTIEVVSPESGITCDPADRQRRTTPLRMEYRDGCTDENARAIMVDRQAAERYARLATPDFDQILVLANTETYGGIGGSVATTSGGNSLGPLITPHELGHSLGRLQDEYTYSARGKPGAAYTGGEPESIHLTVLSADRMRSARRKWWRWLGEPSEAGGRIGRYEGGLSRTTGIWRPSRHSMMISLGYYFDQVSRERMTQRISQQVSLIASSTPANVPVAPTSVIWIETVQPVYHELEITWHADGRTIERAANQSYLDLRTLQSTPRQVRATVVDPTPFVRDPEIRTAALSDTRSWIVSATASRAAGGPVAFTGSTPTARAIGGADVVFVATTQPADRVPDVEWRLNGEPVPAARNSRTFALARHRLPPGVHSLSAAVTDPAGGSASETLTWTVDNTPPSVAYELSTPVSARAGEDGVPHYHVRDEFTMKLEPKDDQPGYVVAEFRVNGDGWHHYYGWPDAPPGTPFRFTPRGTTIKELVYGSLSAEGLSPQPWEPRKPGWGTHLIEYRAIDAAGNISAPKAFRITIAPSALHDDTTRRRRDVPGR